ncbi:MAG TPA: rod shape-determining protein MreC [Candidatus Nanoarchaeia archaeon]|nr:rod shape-determining protein MreC [Candidatus Nanoarchaeia archaeon]
MRRKPGNRILVLVAIGLVLVVMNTRGWLSPVKRLVSAVFRPAASLFGGAGSSTGNFFSLVGDVRNLSAENRRLASENADLRQKLAEDAELRQQNDALRRQLSFGEAESKQLLPAEVVSYQPDDFRQFLTVNRGSRDGIKEGMAVTAEGRQLVGKVSEVSDHEAKIFLLTDPTFRVGALDQESRATGTIRGQIGSGLTMEKIAQTDVIKPGDTVITSGLGGELPKGLVIGRVESVDQKDNAVFQSAQIVSELKISKLELVFVVLGS